jgi:hypothetical protein
MEVSINFLKNRTMRLLFLFLFFFSGLHSFSQAKKYNDSIVTKKSKPTSLCKTEIYFLKKNRVINDSLLPKSDLQQVKEYIEEPALFTNNEIISYQTKKYVAVYGLFKRKTTAYYHTLILHDSTKSRFNKIDSITSSFNARKFIIVFNNKILITGYLFNKMSSIVPDGLRATIDGCEIDFTFGINEKTPVEMEKLANCFKQQKKFMKLKTEKFNAKNRVAR